VASVQVGRRSALSLYGQFLTPRCEAITSSLLATSHQNGQSVAAEVNEPNAELRAIYEADQADRLGGFRPGIGGRDEARLHRVLALIQAGELRCADDYFHAAIALHHSPILVSSEQERRSNYLRAHEFAKQAAELGDARGRWLAAASYDRWLMTGGGSAPRVVLITGLPGTGKTTVGRRIADHFGWPFITKDAFKELIFNGLGWSDKRGRSGSARRCTASWTT
jgi:ATPase family associated with various cellular activities (AAA)